MGIGIAMHSFAAYIIMFFACMWMTCNPGKLFENRLGGTGRASLYISPWKGPAWITVFV